MAIDWADPNLFSGDVGYSTDTSWLSGGGDTNWFGGDTLNLGDSSGWNTGGTDLSWLDSLFSSGGNLLSGAGNFLTSPGGALAATGILGSILDGEGKPTQTSYLYSPEATTLGQQVGASAGNMLNRPVQGYTGALTVNASPAVAHANAQYSNAVNQAQAGALSMPEGMNLQAYMNPYAQSAIDPVARMMMEDYSKQKNTLNAQAGMKGAFGSTRNRLDSDLLQGRQERSIGDLYQTGLGKAYESAIGQYNTDQARKLSASGALTAAGAGFSKSADNLTALEQFNVTNPYAEFTRQQNVPYAQLGAATSALGALQQRKPAEVTTPPDTSLYQAIPGALLSGYGLNAALK